ncbi:MAG: tetratricopeptide repeat protein [Nitrospinae bacterium]|nr:tetratricopeptide repeat protein [Nitrospinota bacterium]
MVENESRIVEILRFFNKSAQSRMMALDERHQKIWLWVWKMLTSRESILFTIIISFSIVVGLVVNVWLQELDSAAGILFLLLVVVVIILLTTSVGKIVLAGWTAPGFAIERMISAGRVYLESRHPQAAVRAFDEVLRLDRNLGEAYRNRGLAEAMMGDYEAAVEDFDRAIFSYRNKKRSNKDLWMIHCVETCYISRGIAKTELGFLDEAREDLTTALDLAGNAGDESLITLAKQELQKLDK